VLTRLYPELVWLEERFQRGVAVDMDGATGRIARVGPVDRASADAPGIRALELPGKALLPGFVNAHSHAFQRLIRGRTQRPPANGGADADFWSWREAMYGAALALSADDVYDVARFCFLEMLRTGITVVGEFHYLHHQPDGRPYPDPNELAVRVLDAAAAVGIRIVLLNVCYAAGGIGAPVGERQRRFRTPSLEDFLARTTALDARAAGRPLATIGVAPHSLRAVPRPWLRELSSWAGARGLPLHLHVSEQPAEVEAVVAAYGLRPVEVLAEDGLLGPALTAIHATHLSDREVSLLGGSESNVCACPTTERDLGDGFLRGKDLLDAGARICLGTDSHTTLDFLDEMRLIEYHERLLRLRRAVITVEREDRRLVAPPLLRMATESGGQALGLDGGRIEEGRLADLVAVDLDHHALAGWTDSTLAPTLVLSAAPDVVSDVWVGGERRLRDRSHENESTIQAAFEHVARNRVPA
jgi:formimidoylglutamate deiminase